MLNIYDPGELNNFVQLQSPTKTTGAAGGVSISGWTTYDNAWAKIKPMSSDAKFVGNMIDTVGTYLIYVNYRTDISVKDRIRFDDDGRVRLFEIKSYTDAGISDKEFTEITAKEVQR